MKRNEMKVGTEYAVLAPSQRAKVDSNYGPDAKHVRVLDVEPIWSDRYIGWGGWDKLPKVSVVGFNGEKAVARDRTERVSETSYGAGTGKRYVKVLVGKQGYGYKETKMEYEVVVVPISQVAMTWAEYDGRRKTAEARRDREYRQARKANDEKAARTKAQQEFRDELNETLASTNLTASLGRDGEVVITGSNEDLRDLANVLANA